MVTFGLVVRYIDEHKLITGNGYIWFGSSYIDEHKLITGNGYIWFVSKVYR